MNSRTGFNYGWVVVAAGAVITCVAMGALFALPVYQTPMADDTGWARAGIAGATGDGSSSATTVCLSSHSSIHLGFKRIARRPPTFGALGDVLPLGRDGRERDPVAQRLHRGVMALRDDAFHLLPVRRFCHGRSGKDCNRGRR